MCHPVRLPSACCKLRRQLPGSFNCCIGLASSSAPAMYWTRLFCARLQDMYKAYQVEPHVALHAPVQARPHTKFEGASLGNRSELQC